MYQFDFLEASVPLTKHFQRTAEGHDVTPYPMVRNFTSHRRETKDLASLLILLQQHAALGHCLLKGLSREPLVKQSRAGFTNAAEETTWLLLDLDFEDGWTSISDFLDDLDPALKDVSYIFQHSSSAGIKGVAGLRGHVWIMLDKPILPTILKEWLRAKNLGLPKLLDRVQLSVNGHSLRWPLDLTTCQNDKLIYIAPPVCEGFADPLKEKRFELVQRKKATAGSLTLTFAPAVLAQQQKQRVDELRKKAGLPADTAKYKRVDGEEVLQNPDEAVVTGYKRARGFVYLNLNGGNSWGYYFHEQKPELLKNFKGEPAVRLRDVAPSFYDQVVKQIQAETAHEDQTARRKNRHPFVFRDRARDLYYNAVYYPAADSLELSKTMSLQRLQHFLMQYGEDSPDIIEDWTVEFDPTQLKVVDFENRWLNTFDPSPYLRAPNPGIVTIPPVISKVIDSVCGNDSATKRHFLNWLAHIFQTRQKAATAWIFHGIQGTGKGVLVSRILKPLLGPEHVVETTLSDLEDRFNASLERALILWVDEFHVDNARQADLVMNRLKNWITETRVSIRGMRQNAIMVRSYVNVIIATNHPDPVQLPQHDRRFNVAPAQENQLHLTANDLDQLDAELGDFAGFLKAYQVDSAAVRKVLLNEARETMITASQTTVDRFFIAARNGDLEYFAQFLEAKVPLTNPVLYTEFEAVLTSWYRASLENVTAFVPRTDLHKAYSYIVGASITPAKFGRMCTIHRLTAAQHSGKGARGFHTRWFGKEEDVQRLLAGKQITKPKLTVVTS